MANIAFQDLSQALPAERTFKPGQQVRWNPPQGAYGPKSMQALAAGQTGVVRRVWNDSYLLAHIGGWKDVLLNVDFVEAV